MKGPIMDTFPISQAVTIASHVDYAAQAIVSKTLVKKESGTITLFAFAKDQGLSEHTAPFDAIVHILDGEARLVIGGQEVLAGTGQMVLMPANVPHAVHAVENFKMLLVMIRG